MIKQIFQCEKCQREWPFDNSSPDYQMVCVTINVNFGCAHPSQYENHSQTWCRECVMRLGIKEPVNDQDKKVAPEKPLTFEEKFVLLVEELGFRRGE